MNSKMKDGTTILDQLKSVWRQTGRKPKELDNLVTLPNSFSIVWKWFIDLHGVRTSNGFGPNPISYLEMQTYFKLMGIDPEPWEIEIIRGLDDEYLKTYAEKRDKSN